MKCTMTHDCQEPAIASYVWPWGEEGLCCATHRPLLAQTEKNTKRRVSLAMLNPGAPVPMTRDERRAHFAENLALKEELDESRARAGELHRAHEDLVRQLRTETAKRGALEAETKAATTRARDLEARCAELAKERDRLQEEVQRLRARDAVTLPNVVE